MYFSPQEKKPWQNWYVHISCNYRQVLQFRVVTDLREVLYFKEKLVIYFLLHKWDNLVSLESSKNLILAHFNWLIFLTCQRNSSYMLEHFAWNCKDAKSQSSEATVMQWLIWKWGGSKRGILKSLVSHVLNFKSWIKLI